MANTSEQMLHLLDQSLQDNPIGSENRTVLENLNAQYEKDPGAYASQGLVRDTMRLLGQVPAGFLEGFTTIETDFIPPRSEAEHIARSLGSLAGFIGYVPNPAALTAKAGLTLGSKGLAQRYVSKKAVNTLEKEAIAKMTKEELAEKIALVGGTNVWKHGSVPIGSANLAMKFISPRVAPSLNKILNTSKFLKPTIDKAGKVIPHKFLNPQNIISTGKGAMHLGLASAVAAAGVNPWQLSERILDAIPAFFSGAVFGAGFKTIGNVGLAMKGMVVDGQPVLAAKIAQAAAGSLWQGLPATMRDATTSEQVYEYLLGAWFGFHEVPWSTQRGAEFVNKEVKVPFNHGELRGFRLSDAWHTPEGRKNFKTHTGKEVDDYFGLPAIRKNFIPEYADAIEHYIKKATEVDPRVFDNFASGRQDAGWITVKDENNQDLDIRAFWRNPNNRSDVEKFTKVAQYDTETGSIVVDAFQLEPAIKHLQENGFKPTQEGVIGFDKGVLKDKHNEKGLFRNFLLNHEAFHSLYAGNENLATAVALAETLGKDRLGRIPKNLIDGLDGASKLTYDEYLRRFDMVSPTRENTTEGTEVVVNAQIGKIPRYKRGIIKRVYNSEDLKGYDDQNHTYRIDYMDGDRPISARFTYSHISDVLPPRKVKGDTTPAKDGKKPSVTPQELKKVSEELITGKDGRAVDIQTGKVIEVEDKPVVIGDQKPMTFGAEPIPTIDISKSKRKSPYFEKDQKKFESVTKIIAFGEPNTSSKAYAETVDPALVNPKEYSPTDIVGYTINGGNKSTIDAPRVLKEITKAVEAGATIVGDGKADRSRDYNSGERIVVGKLQELGYKEVSDGVWKPTEAAELPVIVGDQKPMTFASPKEEAAHNVAFGQPTKNEQAKIDRLSPEEQDLLNKKVSIQGPRVEDKASGTDPVILDAPTPKPKTTTVKKSVIDKESSVPQEATKELNDAKLSRENVKNLSEEIPPAHAENEEVLFRSAEDDVMAYRWSSIVRNRFQGQSLEKREQALDILADKYKTFSDKEFRDMLGRMGFTELEKQSAITYFDNFPAVRAIEFDSNGQPFVNPRKRVRNALVHKIYDVRNNPENIIYMDSQTEKALRARISEDQLGRDEMAPLSSLVNMAGMKKQFELPIEEGGFGINFAEYHDFMQPSGKYSRFLLKYPKELMREVDGVIKPPTKEAVEAFHAEQMSFMMGDAYLDMLKADGQHNKANKYFGLLFSDANFIKTDEMMNVAYINDENPANGWTQGVHKLLKKGNLYGGGDSKSKVDGAIILSNKLKDTVLNLAGIDPKSGRIENFKPLVARVDPESGDRYIFKGMGFAEPELQAFMDANGLDMLVLKSSGKVFQLKGDNVKPTEVEIDRVLNGDNVRDIMNVNELNMSSIGIIKEEQAKSHATASTQMNDSVSNSKDFTHSFIDAFVSLPASKLKEISTPDVIYDPIAFKEKLFEALGVKRTDTGLEYVGSEAAQEFIRLLSEGVNPWNPIVRDQTMHYMRHFLLNVAKPQVDGASYVTLSPDWKGELRERYVENGQIMPGQVNLPSSMGQLKQRIGDLMVFDNIKKEYVEFMDFVGEGSDKYLAGKDTEITLYDAHDIVKNVMRDADLLVLFQRSPKQKPEDTLLLGINTFLNKEYGHVAKLNTLDASIASESDWDGDAGSFIPKLRKEMIPELTRGVLDENGKLRVGAPNVPKAQHADLDIRDYKKYTDFNDTLYTASQKVGQVVNTRTLFTSAVNANLSANVGGYDFKVIPRRSSTFKDTEALLSSHVQQVVDAASSVIDDLVLRKDYNTQIKRMLFGDAEGNPFRDSVHSWLTAHISDAIRMTNPKKWNAKGGLNNYDLAKGKYIASAYKKDPELAVGLQGFKEAFKKRKLIEDVDKGIAEGERYAPEKLKEYNRAVEWLKEYDQLDKKTVLYTELPAEHLEILIDGWGNNREVRVPADAKIDYPIVKIKDKELFNSTPRQQLLDEIGQLPDAFITTLDERAPKTPKQILSVVDKIKTDRDRFTSVLHNISIFQKLGIDSKAVNGDMFDRLPERLWIDGKQPLKEDIYKRAFDRMMVYKLVYGSLVNKHPSGFSTKSEREDYYRKKAIDFKTLAELNNIDLKSIGLDTKVEIDKLVRAKIEDRGGYQERIEALWNDSRLEPIKEAFLLSPLNSPRGRGGEVFNEKTMFDEKRSGFNNFVAPNKFMFELLQTDPIRFQSYNDQWNKTYNDFHAGKVPNKYLQRLQATPKGEDRSRHNFPYETNTKPIMYTFGKPLTELKPYQQAFFESAFAEVPGLKSNWMEFVTGLIGKPHIETNAEIQQVMTTLRKYMNGEPFLSIWDRQMMPEVLGKKMASFDSAFAEKRPFSLLGSAGIQPLSTLQRSKRHFTDAHFDIDGERTKMTQLLRDVFYDFSDNTIVKNWYGGDILAPEHKEYKDRFRALVEQFRTGHMDEAAFHDIAVKFIEYKTVERHDVLSKSEQVHRAKRYKEAKLNYDQLDDVSQRYIDHLVGRISDINKFIYENYWENKSNNKYSVKRAFHNVHTYMYPKWIRAQEEVVARATPENRYDEQKKLNGMRNKYLELRAEQDAGLINRDNPKINRGWQDGYFHRTWKDVDTRIAYEEQAMEERIANLSPEKQAEARKDFQDKQKKKIEDQEQKPDASALFDKAPDEAYSLFRFNPAAEQRSETPVGGYRTDMPSVMMEYFGKTLNQAVKMEAGLKVRLEVDSFMQRMRNQYNMQEREPQNYDRLEKFMHSYIMDNLGYLSEYARQPQLFKYAWAKLTGKKPEQAPADYEAPYHTDVTVMEKINAKRLSRGKKPLPMSTLAKWAQTEGKFQLMALLAHPKFSLTNMFTGSINTIAVGGIKRFAKAGKLLDPKGNHKEFIEMIEAEGIMPDMLNSEFGVVANQYQSKYPAFAKGAKEIWAGEGTRQEKFDAIRELGKDTGIGEDMVNKAAYFMRGPEQWLRKRAFVVGYQIGQEQGFTGEALTQHARDFVISTQYLYHNAVRPEYMRTSLGKITTRFMSYMFNTVALNTQLREDAKKTGYRRETEEYRRYRDWMGSMTVMLAMASLYPYSLFDSGLPPHLDYMKDAAELLFGDEEDREKAFFGTYGLNTLTSPTVSKLMLRPVLTLMNGDIQQYLDRELWTLFPFGRFAKSSWTSFKNPYYALETWTGIPLHGFAKERKKIQTRDKNNERSLQYPG